jgi:hypothetical protein
MVFKTFFMVHIFLLTRFFLTVSPDPKLIRRRREQLERSGVSLLVVVVIATVVVSLVEVLAVRVAAGPH